MKDHVPGEYYFPTKALWLHIGSDGQNALYACDGTYKYPMEYGYLIEEGENRADDKSLYFVSDGKKAGITSIKNGNAEICLSSALSEGRNQIFDGVYLDCEIIDSKNYRTDNVVNKKLTFYLLDYDKIIGRAILRNRRFGDRIQLRGRSFTSSVKKLINEKIPPQERASLHFIEDDEGTIFAEKLGIAGRVAPDGDTRRFLRITVVRER